MDQASFEKIIEDCDNVIFDFGGVFVDIHYQDAIEALQNLAGNIDVYELYNKQEQIPLFNFLETGLIGEAEFIQELGALINAQGVSQERIKNAWCSMLKGIHLERIHYLKELSARKRVFMLSNINEIHEAFLREKISSMEETKLFYSYFEKVYFSHRMGARKPDLKAFQIVLEENQLDPKKTFFFDDSPQHVEGAKKAGMKAALLDPPNCFIAKYQN